MLALHSKLTLLISLLLAHRFAPLGRLSTPLSLSAGVKDGFPLLDNPAFAERPVLDADRYTHRGTKRGGGGGEDRGVGGRTGIRDRARGEGEGRRKGGGVSCGLNYKGDEKSN